MTSRRYCRTQSAAGLVCPRRLQRLSFSIGCRHDYSLIGLFSALGVFGKHLRQTAAFQLPGNGQRLLGLLVAPVTVVSKAGARRH